MLFSYLFYLSPNQSCLRKREEVVRYLTSPSTCKCGLKCPFSFDEHFSFDPNVIGLPDSRPFTGYSDCSLTPNLYLDNKHGRKKTGNVASRKGGVVSTKPKTNVSANKGKSKMQLPYSKEMSHHPLSGKNINNLTNPQPQVILTAPNGKGGEISYPVLDFQSLIEHLNSVAKSATGITTSSPVSLPLFVSAHLTSTTEKSTAKCVTSLNSNSSSPSVIVPALTSSQMNSSIVPPSKYVTDSGALCPQTSTVRPPKIASIDPDVTDSGALCPQTSTVCPPKIASIDPDVTDSGALCPQTSTVCPPKIASIDPDVTDSGALCPQTSTVCPPKIASIDPVTDSGALCPQTSTVCPPKIASIDPDVTDSCALCPQTSTVCPPKIASIDPDVTDSGALCPQTSTVCPPKIASIDPDVTDSGALCPQTSTVCPPKIASIDPDVTDSGALCPQTSTVCPPKIASIDPDVTDSGALCPQTSTVCPPKIASIDPDVTDSGALCPQTSTVCPPKIASIDPDVTDSCALCPQTSTVCPPKIASIDPDVTDSGALCPQTSTVCPPKIASIDPDVTDSGALCPQTSTVCLPKTTSVDPAGVTNLPKSNVDAICPSDAVDLQQNPDDTNPDAIPHPSKPNVQSKSYIPKSDVTDLPRPDTPESDASVSDILHSPKHTENPCNIEDNELSLAGKEHATFSYQKDESGYRHTKVVNATKSASHCLVSVPSVSDNTVSSNTTITTPVNIELPSLEEMRDKVNVFSSRCNVTVTSLDSSKLCFVPIQKLQSPISSSLISNIDHLQRTSVPSVSQSDSADVVQANSKIITMSSQFDSQSSSLTDPIILQTAPCSESGHPISHDNTSIPPCSTSSSLDSPQTALLSSEFKDSCCMSDNMKGEAYFSEQIIPDNQNVSEEKIATENASIVPLHSSSNVPSLLYTPSDTAGDNHSYNNNIVWMNAFVKQNALEKDEKQSVFPDDQLVSPSINTGKNEGNVVNDVTVSQDGANQSPVNDNDDKFDPALYGHPCREYILRKRQQSIECEEDGHFVPPSGKCFKGMVPPEEKNINMNNRRLSEEGVDDMSGPKLDQTSDFGFAKEYNLRRRKYTCYVNDFQDEFVETKPSIKYKHRSTTKKKDIIKNNQPKTSCCTDYEPTHENQSLLFTATSMGNPSTLDSAEQTNPLAPNLSPTHVSQPLISCIPEPKPGSSREVINLVPNELILSHQDSPTSHDLTVPVNTQEKKRSDKSCTPIEVQEHSLDVSSPKSNDATIQEFDQKGSLTSSSSGGSDFYVNALEQSCSTSKEKSLVVRIPLKMLTNHNVIQCYAANNFKIGDVVWAKAENRLAGWPAKIILNTDWTKHKLGVPPPKHVRIVLL